MISRLLCSRDDASARRGILLTIALIVPLAFLVSLVGMAARVLFPAASPEAALPLAMQGTQPPLLGGLAMLALLSAFLSSADSTLVTLTTVVAGAAAVAVGLRSGGIIASLMLAYTVFSGGLAVPIVAGLVGRPMRTPAALASSLAGGGLALAGRLLSMGALTAAAFGVSLAIWAADRLRESRGADRPRIARRD